MRVLLATRVEASRLDEMTERAEAAEAERDALRATMASFADRIEQAEPWLHKGARFTKWAKALAADLRDAARCAT